MQQHASGSRQGSIKEAPAGAPSEAAAAQPTVGALHTAGASEKGERMAGSEDEEAAGGAAEQGVRGDAPVKKKRNRKKGAGSAAAAPPQDQG